MYVGPFAFMAAVVVFFVGLGFWLEGKLEGSHQDVKLPTAYKIAA